MDKVEGSFLRLAHLAHLARDSRRRNVVRGKFAVLMVVFFVIHLLLEFRYVLGFQIRNIFLNHLRRGQRL